MAPTFNSGKTGEIASSEALENKEGDAIKPSIDKVANDSATRAGDRMKRNEKDQIFSK
jgi:hypothetical protein